jgi:hypothetical protein
MHGAIVLTNEIQIQITIVLKPELSSLFWKYSMEKNPVCHKDMPGKVMNLKVVARM